MFFKYRTPSGLNEDIRPDYLSRVPSFIDGATRISGLFGDDIVYSISDTPEEDDYKALFYDGSVTLQALRNAIMAELRGNKCN